MSVWNRRQIWQLAALVAGVLVIGATGRAADDAVEARMRKDITYLASDECEGRGPGTKGIDLAADYIANEFKKAGLKPGGVDGSYFQPFKMTGTARLEQPNYMKLRGPLGQQIELKIDQDFRPLGMSGSGTIRNAPIVFVGYGITAKGIEYDDFKGVDVDGKIVLIVRRTPRTDNQYAPFDGANGGRHAALQTKAVNAGLNKAAAVIFVNDQASAKDGDTLMDFKYTASASGGPGLPAVHVHRAVADTLVQSALGTSLEGLERDIDRDLKPRSAVLDGWKGTLEVNVSRPALAVKNVVGVLEGHGPLAKETVILGAHYDHLGYGGAYSLAKLSKPAIHHGADDNGSGTTTLLELARRFGQKGKNARRLVFIAFSGEESGLLGSAYYCKNPIFPLLDTVVMINMDMVGRLRPDKDNPQKDALEVWGTGTAKTFDKLIDKLTEDRNFKIKKVPGGSGPSDHSSFYSKNIPVFFFFTGNHPDYHRPSDTADKINVPGMRRIANLVEELGTDLASAEQRPQYVKVAGGSPRVSPGSRGPRLGIMPSYSEEGEGVPVEAVVGGGPAEKAGIKAGDRIVAIADKPVKNIEVYMTVMAQQKKGTPLDVGVLRGGKKLTVKVTPE